ncbi:MAG: hypothetical protein RL685_404 [Pseudomonadota bacterium]|jgi:hypothetical protein
MAKYQTLTFAAAVALASTTAGIAAAAEETTTTTTEVEVTEETKVEVKDETEETFWAPRKKDPARMAVAINPVGLIFGLLLSEFDYGLNDTMSLNFNLEYWDLSITTAYGAGVGVQLFMPEVADSGPLYQGFYLYPSVHVFRVRVDPILFLDEYSYTSVAPRFVAGWQWDWRPLTVRAGAGLEYYIASSKAGYDLDLQGLRFVLDGTLGVTF